MAGTYTDTGESDTVVVRREGCFDQSSHRLREDGCIRSAAHPEDTDEQAIPGKAGD